MTSDQHRIDTVVHASHEAYRALQRISPVTRATAMNAAASALEAAADELVPIGATETGLTEGRLRGELSRTAVQLRVLADVARVGSHLNVQIDRADPDFVLGPRPDLRRMLKPVGPVLNFAASNFPFAFSVAGGDTAAALAAGCSVVVKAHPGHPELSRRTAAVVSAALTEASLPAAVLQLVEDQDEAVELLKHPLIRAGSFTGSTQAGRYLADVAAGRPAPIPFYGELGSVNPVFATAGAIAHRGPDIAAGFVSSVSGSAGQLCTKPGFLFTSASPSFDAKIAELATEVNEHRLLNPKITRGYAERRHTILHTAGVDPLVEGSLRVDADGQGWVTPTIVRIHLDDLRTHYDALHEECFGPLSIMVTVPSPTDLASLVSELFQGSLTGTVQIADGELTPEVDNLLVELSEHCGRVIVNSWPTGVAVAAAQTHGGPWPATTIDATSVGTAAVARFLRPVTYQSTPTPYLPRELRT